MTLALEGCYVRLKHFRDPVSEDYLLAFGLWCTWPSEWEGDRLLWAFLAGMPYEVVAKNFLVFLIITVRWRKALKTSIKACWKASYPRLFYLQVYENSLFMGRWRWVEKYFQSYSKLFGDKEPEKWTTILMKLFPVSNPFKQRADLSWFRIWTYFQ